MASCPECRVECRAEDLVKEWDATPRRIQGSIRIRICLWECPACGHRFRTATRTWI